MKPIDVLDLSWTTQPGRDRNVSALITNYIKLNGYQTHSDSIFRGMSLIAQLKPKVVLLPGTSGAITNLNVAKFAHESGSLVASYCSEGNFVEDLAEQDFWGINKKKILYEDTHMIWSNRCKSYVSQFAPDVTDRVTVTGGIGFDYFKIKRKNRTTTPDKNRRKVIGIAGYYFDIASKNHPNHIFLKNKFGKDTLKCISSEKSFFNRLLGNLIKNLPQHDFILKNHPSNTQGLDGIGAAGWDSYPNVQLLPASSSSFEAIEKSDLWITHDSMTSIEAQLMGIPTFSVISKKNPHLIISKVTRNHLQANSMDQLFAYVKSMLADNQSPNIPGVTQAMQEIFEDIFQWSDGYNHVRGGNEIIKLINTYTETNQKERYTLKERYHIIRETLRPLNIFDRGHRNALKGRKNWNQKQLQLTNDSLLDDQINYYQKNNRSLQELYKNKFI